MPVVWRTSVWLGATGSRPRGRIALGSCNREDLPQPLWDPILATAPDLWVWLGDNVYADSEDSAVLRASYAEQLGNPGYRRLIDSVPVIGTWDDHDYGANDAGKEYPTRAESQQILLDFLGEPADTSRRRQQGVYASYTFGDPPRRLKVILLDARFHRDAPGPDADTLGEVQWVWLERQLGDSDAQVHLIASGYQFLPEDHPFEKWANFPKARRRLLNLIGETGAPGVVLLSGDRHLAEISRIEDPALSSPLYELTTSGLTHSWADHPGEPSRHRLGDLYTQLNFGVIEVAWGHPRIEVTLQIRAADGSVVNDQRIFVR